MEGLIREYLNYRRTLGLSRATLKLDRVCLSNFEAYLNNRRLTCRQVTIDQIKEYWGSIRRFKPGSIQKYLIVVKRFYHYLYHNHLVLLDPCRNLELPRKQRCLPAAIPTVKQMKQILDSINLTTLMGIRDRAILELVYSAGLRLSETSGLNIDDLDLANHTLKVHGKGSKDRVVPFGKSAAFYLKLYLKTGRNPKNPALFQSAHGKRLGRSGLEALFWSHARKFGWKFRFHSLRHACALHLLQNKAGIRHIQELLGHNEIRSTQIYTQLAPLDLKKAHRRYHPREKEAYHE